MTTLEYPPDNGGVGQSVQRIGRMIAAAGHEVHVVVFHPTKIVPGTAISPCFETHQDGMVHVHRFRPSANDEGQKMKDLLADVWLALDQLHRRERFDLIHSFYLNEAAYLSTLFARENNLPNVLSVRGADIHRNPFHPGLFAQLQWTLLNAGFITAVSRTLAHRIRTLVPETASRLMAFPNSIEPFEMGSITVPPRPAGLDGTVIGWFGTLRNKKGAATLIEACEILSRTHQYTLMIVGDIIEPEKTYWSEVIAGSAVRDRVVITGMMSRDMAIAHHHHVDIYTIPSLRDGCPNALLEAMMAGQPCIGTATDAIGEVIQHGVNGLLVAPGEAAALAAAMARLIDDPAFAARCGAAARTTAATLHAPQRELACWLDSYERALGKRPERLLDVVGT